MSNVSQELRSHRGSDTRIVEARKLGGIVGLGPRVRDLLIGTRRRRYVQAELADDCVVFLGGLTPSVKHLLSVDQDADSIRGSGGPSAIRHSRDDIDPSLDPIQEWRSLWAAADSQSRERTAGGGTLHSLENVDF